MAFAFDYDLTVIGATTAGAAAAIAAAQSYARVAWVCPKLVVDPLLLLREGSRTCKSQTGLKYPTSQDWADWLVGLGTGLDPASSRANAQFYGVHCLDGPISFQTEDRIQVQVGDRTLRSQTYLLTMESAPHSPKIPGIDAPQVWHIPQLWDALHKRDGHWPQRIAILGHGPQAVELSQSLQRMGRSVLLLTNGHPLLPHEDGELAILLQRYLEGNGIRIDMHHVLTHIESDSTSVPPNDLCLTVGKHLYTSETLIVAIDETEGPPSVLAPLNLRQTGTGLWVNSFLQTSIPSIYACGALLGGYSLPSLALYEARLAVQNALGDLGSLGPRRSPLNYHQVPYAIQSDPPLARVGLTEDQARAFDPQIQVIRQPYNTCDRAFFEQSPTGLCKVIVQPDGNILGAHLLGPCAPELIHLFALAIQQGARLHDLNQLGFASPTFMQVIQQAVQQWQQYRWSQNRDRQERRFYKKRKRTP